MKIIRNRVKGYNDIEIPFNIISKAEGTGKLAIVLPGAGYTVQAPFLHYSVGIFINRSYDVLEINYNYEDEKYEGFGMEELAEAVKTDARCVIDAVLSSQSYDTFCLIGKSLGTIAMASELKRKAFEKTKAVWLTPLLQRDEVFESMQNDRVKGLCIIGSDDQCYIEERYKILTRNQSLNLKLIPGVNHSLEYDENPVKSIDVLKNVMQDINNV